ncbi:unnamed protein product [Camellia sinensis]
MAAQQWLLCTPHGSHPNSFFMSPSPFFDRRRVTSGDNGGDRLAAAVAAIGERCCLCSLRFSESKLPQNEVEHGRLVEAYSVINQKLKHSLSEQTNLERTIQELKKVTIIIKECRDVQLRCGSVGDDYADYSTTFPVVELNADSDVENVISERLCMTSVTGLNNNECRIATGQVLNRNTGLDRTCNFVKVHHKAEQKTMREPHLRIWILDLDFMFYLDPLTRHRFLADAHQWVPLGEVGAREMTVAAREGCRQLRAMSPQDRSKILQSIADALEKNERLIAIENEGDVAAARMAGYEQSLIARLTLKPGKISSFANSIRVLANMEEPIGCVLKKTKDCRQVHLREDIISLGCSPDYFLVLSRGTSSGKLGLQVFGRG